MRRTIGIDKKTGEAARDMSRSTQEYAHTAMDYALKAQEVNARILQRTSRAWIDGFRYQASLSQGMAQGFFGHRSKTLASTTLAERPAREQSNPEPTEPAAREARKDAEVAAQAARQKAEKQKAEKQKAEKQRVEKVARETRKAEEAAEKTREANETAAKSAQKSAEPAVEETKNSTGVVAEDAAETKNSTGPTARDAQKTGTGAFPIDGYDEMNVGEATSRLDDLSADELKRVEKYEKDHKDRGTLLKEMKQKIETTS